MPFSLPGGSGGGGGGTGTAPTMIYESVAGADWATSDLALVVTADPDGFEVLLLDIAPDNAPRQLVAAQRPGTAWPATETDHVAWIVSDQGSNLAELNVWSTGATNLTVGEGQNWQSGTENALIHRIWGFRSMSDYLRYGRGDAGPRGLPGEDGDDSVTLSDTAPLAPGTAAAGTSDEVSRADHVHPEGSGGGAALSDATPQTPGTAAAGTSDEASRADHVHPEQDSVLALDQHGGDLTLDEVGQVINTGTSLRRVARRHGTPPTVVWQSYSHNADISTLWGESTGTYRWRGRHPRGSSVTNPAVGDVFCTDEGNFERYSTVGAVGWWHLAAPAGWLGVFLEGEDEADRDVSATDQVAAWSETISRVTSYTAGTQERAVLRDALPPGAFVELTDTPSSLGTAGQRLAMNAGADALEFVDASEEQSSGSGGGWTTEHPVTARNELAGNTLNAPFSSTSIHWNDFTIASIAKTALREIEVSISVQERFDYYARWGPAAIERIGAYPGGWRDDTDTSWPWQSNNQRIPALYLSGENDTGSDKRDPPLLLPSFYQANSRRQQEIESFFVFLIQGGVSNENLTGIRIYYSGDINTYLERLAISYAG